MTWNSQRSPHERAARGFRARPSIVREQTAPIMQSPFVKPDDMFAHQLMPVLIAEMTLLYGNLNRRCESPIETKLGVALIAVLKVYWWPYRPEILPVRQISAPEGLQGPALAPQFIFQNYRIDWAAFGAFGRRVFIECDGHDFHERTKEQAARDRNKDRAIQTAGIPILRFTGTEIVRNPIACAEQVLPFLRHPASRSS